LVVKEIAMSAIATQSANGSVWKTRTTWLGRVLSALPVLMLLSSSAFKLSHAPEFVRTWTDKFGYPENALTPIGVVELLCTVLYVIPRTSVLGALLLTAYLGGAVTTHVRVADPFAIPIVLGILVWAGLYLRDDRLRSLLPLRQPTPAAR